VRGVGHEDLIGNSPTRTPPRKIRLRFRGYKHILLIMVCCHGAVLVVPADRANPEAPKLS
jgi:hypothetical protein